MRTWTLKTKAGKMTIFWEREQKKTEWTVKGSPLYSGPRQSTNQGQVAGNSHAGVGRTTWVGVTSPHRPEKAKPWYFSWIWSLLGAGWMKACIAINILAMFLYHFLLQKCLKSLGQQWEFRTDFYILDLFCNLDDFPPYSQVWRNHFTRETECGRGRISLDRPGSKKSFCQL